MDAAQKGALASLRMLVKLGASLNATNHDGETAVVVALLNNHPEFANWLRSCVGWSALHRACDNRAGRATIIELLRGGADPFLPSAAGETPLQICRLADANEGALPTLQETAGDR